MKHFRDWSRARELISSPEFVRLNGPRLPTKADLIRAYTKDEFVTYDQATLDSAGAFLIGELEKLDPMIHEPLVSVTWQRDIDLRTDVNIGDTASSFTQSSFGAGGTPDQGLGISWASAETTTLPRATLDIAKLVQPLDLWSMEVAYTVPELEMSRVTGRPVDSQQLTALNLKHQMDTDQLVYVGDPAKATTGMLNYATVTNISAVPNGVSSGSPLWATKTPQDILNDVNQLLVSVWAATGYSVPPTTLLLPPVEMGALVTTVVSTAGTRTIADFLKENNILTAEKGIDLDIKSVKWLDKSLSALNGQATDFMMAYSRNQRFIRYPLVPLIPMAPQFRGIWVAVPYYGRLGVVEVVYPETIGVRTGLR